MDRWLVVGSALYWAAVGLRFLIPTSPLSEIWGPWNSAVKYSFLLLALAVSYALMRGLGVRRARVVLSWAVLAAIGLQLFGSLAAAWTNAYGVYLALEFFIIGAFMLLWGIAYASFDKHRAAQNVIATILLAALLMLGVAAASPITGLTWPSYGLYGFSAVIVLMGRVPCANHEREGVARRRRHEVMTVLQRLVFGTTLTVCSVLACNVGFGAINESLLIMAAVVLGASFFSGHPVTAGYVYGAPCLALYSCWRIVLAVF